jgi:endo-1,4-beta-xylanase
LDLIKYTRAAILIFISLSCSDNQPSIPSLQWTITGTILLPRPASPLDNIAVKDPSIVYFNGQYHLFYTAKSKKVTEGGLEYHTGCAYVHAPTLETLNDADRISIDSITGIAMIAPQVFYFKPGKCWYLIAHTPVLKDELARLTPVFTRNPDIENPAGWSEPEEIMTCKIDQGFWIDFWVICDNEQAWIFYADQKGSVFRLGCRLEEFPQGFSRSSPACALHVDHMDEPEPWRMFEAVHVYYVEKEDDYLAILEGAYAHPSLEGQVDSRNRFIFGMRADSLNGTWERIEPGQNQFLAEAKNIRSPKGSRLPYTQVSHPELIRAGYDQELVIADYNLSMIFQTFDGSAVPDSYNYNDLPWELILMKNQR